MFQPLLIQFFFFLKMFKMSSFKKIKIKKKIKNALDLPIANCGHYNFYYFFSILDILTKK